MAKDFWMRAQEGEREYWDSVAARNDAEGDPERRKAFWNAYLEVIRKHRPFQPGDRVLDVGCGPSGILYMVEDSCRRYGVDPLMDAYAGMYRLSPGILYSRQLGESLAFQDGFFQVVTCINVIDHTKNPLSIWSEIHRVLEPGGLLLLEVDTFKRFKYYHKRFKRWIRMTRSRLEKHPHTFRIPDVLESACRAGFKVLEQRVTPNRKREALLLLLEKQVAGS